MASLAISLALHNENISATVFEANEFPDLAQRYNVYGVPRTIINDGAALEGAVPEHMLIDALLDEPKRS